MKFLTIFFVLLITSSVYTQAHKKPVSYEVLNYSYTRNTNHTGNNILNDNPVLDTHGTVPGLTQYWDYVTNGNNLRKIWVLGDTIIIAADYTDSINVSVPTARRTYYQVSYNGGVSWDLGYQPIIINNSTTAYPDLVPLMQFGSRTLGISGLGLTTGAYIGADVILGAGSFTHTPIPPPGPYMPAVSSALTSPSVGCLYAKSAFDSLFFRKYNYSNSTFSAPVFITPLQPNARYYITTSSNGTNVFVMWWNSTPNELKARESTDGGNTFGAVMIVCPSTVNINGETVIPWYAADIVYKPGTTTPYTAFSTLAPGNFATAQGSKVLMWSPAVNGGHPVKIADWRNMAHDFITDTAYFNNNLKEIQVGMTPLSHPSIAFSSDGARVVCAFSGATRDTSSYGFHYNNIYNSYSDNGGNDWASCRQLSFLYPSGQRGLLLQDEIYPSVSKTGNALNIFHITYSLSGYPGSRSFTNTNTPKGKVYQIYRKFCPIICGLGITTISTEIPNSYLLEQNYPNPFNPKTIIRFDILKASDVKITVFDIIGREVTRLVQQKLNAGKYSVDFDAANLVSGIYFYSILADDFVQTKKMILVK